MLFRTVLQLSHSIGQIIVFDKGLPIVNAHVLGNLGECRHKSYIVKQINSLNYILVANSPGLSSTSLTCDSFSVITQK